MAGTLTIGDGGEHVDIAMDTGMVIIEGTGMVIDMDIDMVTMLAEGQVMLPAIVQDHVNPYKATLIDTGQME